MRKIEVYQPLDKEGDLYGYQTFVNVFLLNLRDKYYTKGIKSLDECEKYIMGLVETSWKRTNELMEGSEILMEYKKELEAKEYIDLPDPVDKVAEEIEIERANAYEDGLEYGEAKGEIKGEIKGEMKAYMAVAKHLLSRGMTLADYTNIPVDKVKDLCVRESED